MILGCFERFGDYDTYHTRNEEHLKKAHPGASSHEPDHIICRVSPYPQTAKDTHKDSAGHKNQQVSSAGAQGPSTQRGSATEHSLDKADIRDHGGATRKDHRDCKEKDYPKAEEKEHGALGGKDHSHEKEKEHSKVNAKTQELDTAKDHGHEKKHPKSGTATETLTSPDGDGLVRNDSLTVDKNKSSMQKPTKKGGGIGGVSGKGKDSKKH